MRSTFPRSSLLLLGANSVQSLVPSTLISQVESLLDGHRIPDAIDLADTQRKKLHSNTTIDEDEADELKYVYQRIAFQCFAETRFTEAASNFFYGEVDPRLVISYYPNLRGSLFTSDDSMDVYAGVAERMPSEASVEDIIRNYSPHLSPSTRSSPSTAELKKILLGEASEKLEVFLTRWRTRLMSQARESTSIAGGSGKVARAVDPTLEVVDTVLVKLYAELEKTNDLYNLLLEPHKIIVSEVEPFLQRTGQYNVLCMLYRQRNEEAKLLDVWSKLIDGEWTDDDIQDPLSDMISLLTEKKDRALTRQWGLWLTRKYPDQGLKLLTQKDSGKRRERLEEDHALLEAIKEANPAAGIQYLEYLVLQRRSSSQHLHTLLAALCVDQLRESLSHETVVKLWRAKAASYISGRSDTSFLSYFASTTPDSLHKRIRLKSILFLSGSSLYDAAAIRSLILSHQNILRFELAIIDGKSGNHHSSLSTLVHDLRDTTSAELYCTLGGDIVPVKLAQRLAENNAELEMWVSGLFGAMPKRNVVPRKSAADEARKAELLKILLEVYMDHGSESSTRAAHLINSQAMNLDVLDVIPLIPPDWPLNVMSSFLARSFRRALHVQHEGRIVKTIAAGQNLEVKDRTWLILREEGMVIEEPAEDNGEELASYDEKQGFVEHVTMQLKGFHSALHMDGDHAEKLESGEGEFQKTHSDLA